MGRRAVAGAPLLPVCRTHRRGTHRATGAIGAQPSHHRDGKLYARSASDMKTSLAATPLVLQRPFAARTRKHLRHRFVLLTPATKGPALPEHARVVSTLRERNIKPQYCVVGGPTQLSKPAT